MEKNIFIALLCLSLCAANPTQAEQLPIDSQTKAPDNNTKSQPNQQEENSFWQKSKENVKEGYKKGKDFVKKKYQKFRKKEKTSQDNRQTSNLGIHYSPVSYSLWLPVKQEFTLNLYMSAEWSVEVSRYAGSYGFSMLGFSLAKLSETLYHISFRQFFSNTFNLQYGYGLRTYELKIGNSLAEKIFDTDEPTNIDLLKVSNDIIHLGLGNQWLFNNGITITGDWFGVFIPIGEGKQESEGVMQLIASEEDRNTMRDILSTFEYGTTFYVANISIGYAF